MLFLNSCREKQKKQEKLKSITFKHSHNILSLAFFLFIFYYFFNELKPCPAPILKSHLKYNKGGGMSS